MNRSNRLNVDYGKTIARFEFAMKKKLLIKSIFYKKVFGGKGFEFDSFRNYVIGEDDSGLIDWKASVKANELLVRKYIDERDLNIFFLIDVGDNMIFGSGNKLKIEAAAEISVALNHLILDSGDKTGFAFYNDKLSVIKPFFPGMRQFYSLIKSFNEPFAIGGKSNLAKAIINIMPYLKNSSAVFVISDFLRMDDESAKALSNLMINHEVIGIMIRDEVENKLPDLNTEVVIEDIDSGEQIVINPDMIKKDYEKNALEQKKAVYNLFKRTGTSLLEVENNKDFVLPLVEFLRRRIKKRKLMGGN
jgi:uncharacterized protein (DUF58 family)